MILEPSHRDAISAGLRRYWARRRALGVDRERFERLKSQAALLSSKKATTESEKTMELSE